MSFCENLKRCREQEGLTRKDIAEKIPMTANGYGLYETGRSEPSLEVLCKIARILRTSIDSLLGMKDQVDWKTRKAREGGDEKCDAAPLTVVEIEQEMRRMDATRTMSQVLCRTLRNLVCENQEEPDCRRCPLRNVECYNTQDNIPMQTILMELFRRRPRKLGESEKEECHSDAAEPPATPFKCKTGISYSVDKDKPLRSDSSAKSAKPYPQDTEEDEYRYIDAGWLEAVARGLTAGAEKHPGETWRQIPPEEHAARAMRHLNLYRAGDRKDTHLINAAMRCMMAYATEKAKGEGQA